MTAGRRNKGMKRTSSSSEPLVSIITVVRNGAQYIETAIQSILDQTYSNVEYIIIDGGSTDGTIDIIRKFEDRIDLWISEPDNGIYFAMNKGIELANGTIIGLLNADDEYLKDTISLIIESDKINNADIYYGDILAINNKGVQSREKPDISKMKQMPSIFHPACFVKRSVYQSAGSFDTHYKISADYDFLLRCLERKYFFHYIPEVLTRFRQGGASSSCYSNIEGYRIMKQHGTGYQNEVLWRALKCYSKNFIKKIIHLK